MSRPWMPLYVADYLGDTSHFSAAEHGAYLLLIMHYWQTGSVPGGDDARMARIARMTPAEWADAKPTIKLKFSDTWRHSRIDGELSESERLAKAGRKGGEASGEARRKRNPRPKGGGGSDEGGQSGGGSSGGSASSTIDERSTKPNANDFRTIGEAPHPQPNIDNGTDARAREPVPLISPEAHRLSASFLDALGYTEPIDVPPEFAGIPHRAQVWIRNGWTETVILATTRKIMTGRRDPPHPNYFEKCFATAFASLAADVPQGSASERKPHGQSRDVIAATDRALDRLAAEIDRRSAQESGILLEGSATPVRAIPQAGSG